MDRPMQCKCDNAFPNHTFIPEPFFLLEKTLVMVNYLLLTSHECSSQLNLNLIFLEGRMIRRLEKSFSCDQLRWNRRNSNRVDRSEEIVASSPLQLDR